MKQLCSAFCVSVILYTHTHAHACFYVRKLANNPKCIRRHWNIAPIKTDVYSYWNCYTKLECQAVVQPNYLKQITCFAIKILNILPPAFSSVQNSPGVLWSFVMGILVNLHVWLICILSCSWHSVRNHIVLTEVLVCSGGLLYTLI